MWGKMCNFEAKYSFIKNKHEILRQYRSKNRRKRKSLPACSLPQGAQRIRRGIAGIAQRYLRAMLSSLSRVCMERTNGRTPQAFESLEPSRPDGLQEWTIALKSGRTVKTTSHSCRLKNSARPWKKPWAWREPTRLTPLHKTTISQPQKNQQHD